MTSRSFASLVAVAVVAVVGCEDVRVPIGDTPEPLQPLRPLVCADVPDDVDTPVKVVLVFDNSGSLAFTDPDRRRVEAARQWVVDHIDQPSLFVATVGFGSHVEVSPEIRVARARFDPIRIWTIPDFLAEDSPLDTQTDVEGMLDAVRQLLLFDMLDTDAAELAVTRYVVVIFTDGAPTPSCCNALDTTDGVFGDDPFGCAAEPWESSATAGQPYCGTQAELALCNDADSLAAFRDSIDDAGAPDFGAGLVPALATLEVGGDYNRPSTISAAVADLRALADNFGSHVDVNVGLLFDDRIGADVRAVFGLNRCRIAASAANLADPDGRVVDFSSADGIDFSVFAASPLCPALAPGDCRAFCAAAHDQLVNDFGLADDVCDDAAIVDADGCGACEAAFADKGVLADVCRDGDG